MVVVYNTPVDRVFSFFLLTSLTSHATNKTRTQVFMIEGLTECSVANDNACHADITAYFRRVENKKKPII